MPRGRYAPSPTGGQHLGNARTALVAWARARDADFVVRIEDLDAARTAPAAVTGNLDELRWLGLTWNEGPDVGGPHAPYRQSERTAAYAAALATLEAAGATFACYLSRKDLRTLASAPHAGEAGGAGGRAAYGPRERAENARVAAAKAAAGKRPAVRLAVPPEAVPFEDVLRGPDALRLDAAVGDAVLRRADGVWAYHLAVAVDDGAMGIREVVRGDDLRPSAALQVHLQRHLGTRPPAFLHVPLLLDADGHRLAKRRGSGTLHEMRSRGVPPERVVGFLAWTLGLVPRPTPLTVEDVAATFALDALPAHPVVTTPAALAWLEGGPAPAGPPPAPPEGASHAGSDPASDPVADPLDAKPDGA
ncbi:MAG: tRNA glutamyl-Q(34) synthetase GluQRS [Trueperaceae bacterium]|nr:tRNA glutamyl-Q(34) synthetase GluQRS [Trueperaceae bacterium]